jgi:hypothetical protein
MTMFMSQMLGCLLIAAGIGGAVGWLLRHVSAGKTGQLLADVTAMMRLKEQMLEKARYELREAAAKLQLQGGESQATGLRQVELQLAERDQRIRELEQHLLQFKMQAVDNEALRTPSNELAEHHIEKAA